MLLQVKPVVFYAFCHFTNPSNNPKTQQPDTLTLTSSLMTSPHRDVSFWPDASKKSATFKIRRSASLDARMELELKAQIKTTSSFPKDSFSVWPSVRWTSGKWLSVFTHRSPRGRQTNEEYMSVFQVGRSPAVRTVNGRLCTVHPSRWHLFLLQVKDNRDFFNLQRGGKGGGGSNQQFNILSRLLIFSVPWSILFVQKKKKEEVIDSWTSGFK